MSNLWSRIFNSRRCLLCDAHGAPLCAACQRDWPAVGPHLCPRCGLPSPDGQCCCHCQRQPPAFDRTRAAAWYQWPVDSVIHAFKYRQALWLGPPLATCLQQALPEVPDIDALLPMPIANDRLRERGYNQAERLASPLARLLQRPLLTHGIQRRTSSHHQADLPLAARRQNVKQSFTLTTADWPERLAIVDDVMTTGATADELAATLKTAGVRHIEIWVLARTLPIQDR